MHEAIARIGEFSTNNENRELGTRVPLLFRAPWYEQAKGVVTPALAEMVDWVSVTCSP